MDAPNSEAPQQEVLNTVAAATQTALMTTNTTSQLSPAIGNPNSADATSSNQDEKNKSKDSKTTQRNVEGAPTTLTDTLSQHPAESVVQTDRPHGRNLVCRTGGG